MKWETCELDLIADTTSGGTPTRTKSEYWGGDIPWLKSGELRDCYINSSEEFITESGLKNSSAKLFAPGTLLLALYGATAGKLGILDFPATTNQAVCGITPKEGVVHTKYLYYYLLSKRKQIIKDSFGGAQPNISQGYVRKLRVPVPPISVQEHIADTLDKADSLRRKDQELLQKYDELIQSIFYEMFGNPSANEKGWDMLTIRDLVREVKYGTSSPASEQGAFPYLRMNNITYGGELNLRDLKRIDVSEADYRKYGVQMGDLLFNRTNSKELVGKTTVVDVEEPMVAAGYLIRVRCNELANPYFISAYLNSKVGKRILLDMCKSIVGMANINAQELQNIPIIAPPKALQDAFADKVLAVKKLRFAAVKNTELSEALLASQLQHYF
jgi:type I restriction enzyme S subunit